MWAEPLRAESHRYKVLYGGRGAGRSWSIARTLLLLGLERPLSILCTREIQASIKASVHTLLKEQIEELQLPYEVLDTQIRSANGTAFSFEGLHRNITKIKSYEGIDICWVEEAEHVTKNSWDTLIPTIRRPGSEIWVNFNPDQESDPTYRRFILVPPPDTWICFVTSWDNPWLPDELWKEREYLYSVDPEAAAHVWGGECRAFSKLQILAGKWRVEDFEPGEDWDGPYHGNDFGFAAHPTTAVRVWRYQNRLYVEYESYEVGLGLHNTVDRWKRDVPGIENHVSRADSSRPETINFLRENGMPKMAPKGAPKWKGSVEDGIEHLRSYECIVIHPRCKHAIEEARHYRWKTNTAGDILPVPNPVHDHVIDAIRYALDPLIRRRKGQMMFG